MTEHFVSASCRGERCTQCDPLPTTYLCRWCDDAEGSFHTLYKHAEREHPAELRASLTRPNVDQDLFADFRRRTNFTQPAPCPSDCAISLGHSHAFDGDGDAG